MSQKTVFSTNVNIITWSLWKQYAFINASARNKLWPTNVNGNWHVWRASERLSIQCALYLILQLQFPFVYCKLHRVWETKLRRAIAPDGRTLSSLRLYMSRHASYVSFTQSIPCYLLSTLSPRIVAQSYSVYRLCPLLSIIE